MSCIRKLISNLDLILPPDISNIVLDYITTGPSVTSLLFKAVVDKDIQQIKYLINDGANPFIIQHYNNITYHAFGIAINYQMNDGDETILNILKTSPLYSQYIKTGFVPKTE